LGEDLVFSLPFKELCLVDSVGALCCPLGFEVCEESHGLIISLLWVVLGFLVVAAQRSAVLPV
jgi:hypothetical protein